MKVLKRVGLSVSCLFLAFLASVGMEWCFQSINFRATETLWEGVMKVWMIAGTFVGFAAMVVLIIVAIIVLFIPAEKTLEIFE